MKQKANSGLRAVALCASIFAMTAFGRSAHALVIDPLFDASVTTSEQQVIDGAISTYETMFSNPTTVDIEFMTGTSGGGTSLASDYVAPYATYTSWLGHNAANGGGYDAITAYNSLSYGNKAQQVLFTSADGRALGCPNCVGSVAGEGSISSSTLLDGIVTVGDGYYGNGAQVVYHEIDEVLGIGGQGSVLQASMTATPPVINGETTIGAMDLFRYSAPGTPSLTNSTSASSYFSINGGTSDIVAFNQSGTGDYGDWAASGQGCYIQTYEVCSNPMALSPSSPEGVAMQAIGYDVSTSQQVPEPSSLSIFLAGVAMLTTISTRKAKSQWKQRAAANIDDCDANDCNKA